MHGDVLGERLQQRPPAGRQFGQSDDFHRAEYGGRMGDPADGCGDNIDRTHHSARKFGENSCLQASDGFKPWMISRPGGKIDTCPPRLVQCVGGRADHARQHLDIFQFAHRCFGEDRLDRRAQAFFVDRAGEAAREPHRGLFE